MRMCKYLAVHACRVATPECGTANTTACCESVAVMDVKWYSQFNALLNMLRTLFIVVILAVGVFVFNRDASNLVLVPIERMLKRVKDVSENPLAVKQVLPLRASSCMCRCVFLGQGILMC